MGLEPTIQESHVKRQSKARHGRSPTWRRLSSLRHLIGPSRRGITSRLLPEGRLATSDDLPAAARDGTTVLPQSYVSLTEISQLLPTLSENASTSVRKEFVVNSISKKVGGAALVVVALGGTGTALAATANSNTKSKSATTSTTGYRHHGHVGSGNGQIHRLAPRCPRRQRRRSRRCLARPLTSPPRPTRRHLNSKAAYEVHVTKADGTTHELVLEDSSFNVVSTTTETAHIGHGGPHGGTPLSGPALSSASAAAIAAVPGATVDFASKADADDSSNSKAAYEVHVTKADGTTHELVLEDSSFNVLSTTTETGHFGGPRPGSAGTTSTTSTTGSNA